MSLDEVGCCMECGQLADSCLCRFKAWVAGEAPGARFARLVEDRKVAKRRGHSTSAPPGERPTTGGTPYALAALADEIATLRAAPIGERNATLNTVALKLGRHVGAGALDEQLVHDECAAAVASFGDWDPASRSFEATFRSGLEAGKADPRHAPPRQPASRWTPPTEEAGEADPAAAGESGPVVVTVADVAPERVDWLWPGYLPAGKVCVIDGDPGAGKSTLTLDLAARVTTGSPMPDGAACGRKGAVLLLSAEDGVADTIRPRLDAAGADPTQVHVLTEIVEDGRPRPVDLSLDLDRIGDLVRRLAVVLVVIDPLMAFLGAGVDSHRDQDIRRALHPLARLAEAVTATFLIVRHLNKGGGGHALYRGGGSIGIIGAARAGFLVGIDPEDDTRRVLAMTKMNLAPAPAALAYRLVPDELHGTARIEWDGPVGHRASDLLRPREDDDERTERDEAADWLADYLTMNGRSLSADVKREGRKAGFAQRTVERACRSLGVVIDSSGFPRRTYWDMPQSRQQTPSHAIHASDTEPGTTGATGVTGTPVAPLDENGDLYAMHDDPDESDAQ